MIAVVCSNDAPATLATGATLDIAVSNFDMSNALDEIASAITSTILVMSSASNPNARIVDAAIVALCARSESVACARFKIDSVDLLISVGVKPNFDKDNCNSETCVAVNIVVDPRRFAVSVNSFISVFVAPEIAFTFNIPCSKSANTFTDIAPIATIGAVKFCVIAVPVFFNNRPVLFNLRSRRFIPLSNPSVNAPTLTLICAFVAIFILIQGCFVFLLFQILQNIHHMLNVLLLLFLLFPTKIQSNHAALNFYLSTFECSTTMLFAILFESIHFDRYVHAFQKNLLT